ncbi:GNAT family N-acetyltransferase [Corticicoccus populi]|uniref:GNAT family N-acetyltransferase n=1 Tax=Corticicoccus populi TaxID=1812821 RepID=A0ABW5WUF1_9STAP
MLVHKIDDEVSLRLFNKNDAEEFYHLTMTSKPYLKEWLGWLDYVNTVEDTEKNIQSRWDELKANGGYPLSFAIIYNGRIAGTIGFNQIVWANKTGTVGYWLGEDYQGKGIMSRAFQALINYGFDDLKLNRIEVRAASGNDKSTALPVKFGFKEEGVIRQAEWLYNHYVDHVIYGLLSEDMK